jgi:hypothetical protein
MSKVIDRKMVILEAGAKLAAKYGAANVTRRMVATAAKLAESVVSYYMGSAPDAQRAYKRKMKAMGLSEPDKSKIEAIGAKLRAHGPRDPRDTRKRSAKEVEAIKRKSAAKKVTIPAAKSVAVRPRKTKLNGEPDNRRGLKGGPASRAPIKPPSTKPVAPPAQPAVAPPNAPVTGPTESKTAARQPMAPPLTGLL